MALRGTQKAIRRHSDGTQMVRRWHSAEAVLARAKALPEHRAAATENAEGANAATAADARSPATRFRPGARPECFLGRVSGLTLRRC